MWILEDCCSLSKPAMDAKAEKVNDSLDLSPPRILPPSLSPILYPSLSPILYRSVPRFRYRSLSPILYPSLPLILYPSVPRFRYRRAQEKKLQELFFSINDQEPSKIPTNKAGKDPLNGTGEEPVNKKGKNPGWHFCDAEAHIMRLTALAA